MYPSIADLIRRTLYVDLEDDTTVSGYLGIDSIIDPLFWLTYNNREDGVDRTQAYSDSKSNNFEVSIVSALAFYLIYQGTYITGDIIIFILYVRQLQQLRRLLNDIFEIVINKRDA